MIQCKECGTQLEDGAVFCTNCGGKVESAPEFTYGQPNNQTANSMPVTSVNAIPEGAKKKKKSAFVLVAVLLLAVIAGGVFLFTKMGSKENDLMTASPDVYLKDTLKNSLTKNLNSMDVTDSYLNQQVDAEVKYELSSMLTSTLSSQTGLNLSDIAVKVSSVQDDQKLAALMAVMANGNPLLSLDLFYDLAGETIYGRVPELSSSYFKMDLNAIAEHDLLGSAMDMSASGILSMYPSSEEMKELTTSITDSLLSVIDSNVILDQKVSLTANGITGSYNRFTVAITEGKLQAATLDVLDDLKNSEYFYNLLNTSFEASGMDFDSAVNELSSLDVNSTKKLIDFIVYMDDNGNIIGEEFKLDDANSLGYYIAGNGSDHGISAWLKAEGEEIISLNGKYTDKDGVKNGDITLSIADDYNAIDVSCNFKDVKSTKDAVSGTFTLSSTMLPGSSLTLKLDGNSSNFNVELTASYMAMDLGKLTISCISKENASVPPMDAKAPVYDINNENDIMSFMSEVNIDSFLNDLSNKLGIDLSSLLEYYY